MTIPPGVLKALEGKEDIVILEVGAAEGSDTVDFASYARQMSTNGESMVYAFEPDPRNLDLLSMRVKEFSNVRIIPLAVDACGGYVDLHLSTGKNEAMGTDDWSYSNTIVEPKKHSEVYPWVSFPTTIQVGSISLNVFCEREGIDHVDLLWVDTNGGEMEVLEGAGKVIKRTHWLAMEFDNQGLFNSSTTLWHLAKALPDWRLQFLYNHDFLAVNLAYQRR